MEILNSKRSFLLFLSVLLVYCLIFSDTRAQWVQKSAGIGITSIVNSLASIGTTLFAGCPADGVWISTNNGDNWTQTTLNNQTVNSFYVTGGTVYACGSGIFKSTDLGASWTSLTLNQGVGPIIAAGSYLIAGTGLNGIYYSSNNGTVWTPSSITNGTLWAFANSGSNFFAGMQFGGVKISTNQGANWSNTGLNSTNVLSLLTNGAVIYAGTEFNGIHVSSNNGVNWSVTAFPAFAVYSIIARDSYLFAGSSNVGAPENGGVYISSNGGSTWQMRNQGFGGIYSVQSLLYFNNYIFAGTYGGGVWRRGYADITSPVNISSLSNVVPGQFSLQQNYPNPFNPSTTIRWTVPVSGFVSIKVYNSLGNEIETLVNERQNAGSYSVDFNAASLPSGVYFYSLRTSNFNETKKMLLIK